MSCYHSTTELQEHIMYKRKQNIQANNNNKQKVYELLLKVHKITYSYDQEIPFVVTNGLIDIRTEEGGLIPTGIDDEATYYQALNEKPIIGDIILGDDIINNNFLYKNDINVHFIIKSIVNEEE